MPYFREDFIAIPDGRRSGLTRIELAVLIGILVILVGVGLGPIREHYEKIRIERAVEKARTIDVLLSQYATDNDGIYPVGLGTPTIGTSEGIARNLLENNYTPDATVFGVDATVPYTGKAPDFSDFKAANIGWDFTGGATPSMGITSAAPNLLPMVYSTGEKVTYPTRTNAGLNLLLSGGGPFGKRGVVVAYKENNAAFIKGVSSEAGTECPGFISPDFKDTGPYTQIRP